MDYYKILGVKPSSTNEDIRKAYLEKAKLLHPDKSSFASSTLFQQLHEAYEVLTDPVARAEYELASHDSRQLDSTTIEAAFCAAFGYDLHEFARRSPSSNDSSPSSSCSSLSSCPFSLENSLGATPTQVEVELSVELTEVFVGCTKRLRVDRKVFNNIKSVYDHSLEELRISIGPGWKSGTRITFPGKGDHHPGQAPQDLIFILKEAPHSRFRRKGNDLFTRVTIPLDTAIKGGMASITHLDGRILAVPVAALSQPCSSIVLLGEGMPLARQPGKRGNLHVAIQVKT